MTDVPSCGNSMEFYDMLAEVLPAGARVVEVGVFYGRGLLYLADNSAFEIYGVDQFVKADMPHHPEGVETDQDFYFGCLKQIFAHMAENLITLIALPSNRAVHLFENRSLDCVFLDGNHSYEAVAQDIELWRHKVKVGGTGIIGGDDYIEPWRGVIDAVDEAFPQRQIMGQTWWTWL